MKFQIVGLYFEKNGTNSKHSQVNKEFFLKFMPNDSRINKLF